MAEEEEKQEEKAGGRSPVLLIAIVGVVALVLGAGTTYVVVGGGGETASEESAEGGETAAEEAPAPVPFSERVLSLEPFVVNIAADPYPRYLKLRVELELERPEDKAVLEERMAQIRDALIVLITSKRLADVSDFEGKALLKEEMLDRINGLLDEPAVRSVLFTEFVIQ